MLNSPFLRRLPIGLPFFLLVQSLSCGNASDDTPLTREEFCGRWAEAACQSEVLSVCQAASKPACQASQSDACLKWLPSVIQDQNTDACMQAVAKAYADADLRADELDVVVRLAGPCSRIVATGRGGSACSNDTECDAAAGQRCVSKDMPLGRCEVPELVKAGFPCDEPQQACELGFFCNGENCIAALGTGTECVNNSQCGNTSFCDTACESRFDVGASCKHDYECLSDLCYTLGTSPTCTDRIRLSPAEPLCADLR